MAKGAYIGVKRALPSGYTELDYIESNGKQYINTDFKPNSNTRVVMEVYNDAATTEFLFGARNANSRPEYTFGFAVMSATAVRYDYASVETSLTVDTAVGKMVVDANKSVCLYNSAEIAPTAATFTINYPLYLLAMNTAGSTVSAPASAKLYSCKIYDNGKTVRDYVPCKNDSGVAGLYDFANGKFYASAGSGAFVAGNAVSSPDKYVARKVKSGYIGVATFGAPLGDLEVGETVKLNVNGVPTDFLVVNQGNPNSSKYDASCDGTWLLMKDVLETKAWDTSTNDYANSDIHAYLNGTMLSKFDAGVQGAIKTAKIPYLKGTGTGGSMANGASGLSTKVFLLSAFEVGFTRNWSSYFPDDGTLLSYFAEGTGADANALRVAYLVGTATAWWTRTARTSGTDPVWFVTNSGGCNDNSQNASYGVRPAIIMPPDTGVVGGFVDGTKAGYRNVARKIKKAYIGVNGVAKLWWASGNPISTRSVGDSVYMNVNGEKREFLIVHQGNPSSSLYDASCNGTWLLMKDIYENRQWNSSNSNSYKNSTIYSYLNSTFLELFDDSVKPQIKSVKIPHVNGTTGSSIASGGNGLSSKIFLLSAYEVGWTKSVYQYFPEDGACLSYFSGTAATDSKRTAYLNGTASTWWLRSPDGRNTTDAWSVVAGGGRGGYRCENLYGIRPAMILPHDTLADDDGNIIT